MGELIVNNNLPMLGYKYRANEKIDNEYRDIKSLLKHEYYASNMADLNDPFEGEFDDTISKSLNIFRICRDTKLIDEILNSMKDFKSKLGVYSLELKTKASIFPANELLWSNYANSHKGFCIEYNIDKLVTSYKPFYNVNKIMVDYDNKCPEICIEDITEKDIILQKMYGTKSFSWKYENEFRLIFENAGKKKYHPSALKSIYFGINMDVSRQEEIINGLLGYDVSFYKMKKLSCTYYLKTELIHKNMRNTKNFINKTEYKILKQTHNPIVENFHILLLKNNYSDEYLKNFIINFKDEYATKQFNIFFYDNENVIKLIDKYNLYGAEKEFFSNHLVAQSLFDSNDCVWEYPLKD